MYPIDSGYNRWMRSSVRVAWLVVILASACTKANPAATCADGTCIDPAFPFCDTDGAVAGEAGTCIAVTCTPGAVSACRGDVALTCNATGDNLDELQCAHGCDPVVGCKACDAGQTVCTNGAVAACDASGNETRTACPLGCFQDQPRCVDIDPSNQLAMYLDMVTSPPDLHVTPPTNGAPPATLNSTTGEVIVDGQTLTLPTFLVPAVGDALPIRVYVVHAFTVDDKLTMSAGTANGHGPAVAILATGDITVNAPIEAQAGALASCAGGDGDDLGNAQDFSAASGGGGNATPGGAGGSINGTVAGGIAGSAHGTSQLEPLVGGCNAGAIIAQQGGSFAGSFGGGALQLSSRTQITIKSRVDAFGFAGYTDRGQNGNGDAFDNVASGGGGGGALLLEAPEVVLTSGAELNAAGGAGGQFCPSPTFNCGAAGVGATSTSALASNGMGVTIHSGDTTNDYITGGGGGGLGRVRINTPDGNVELSSRPLIEADLSVGTLRSR